MPFTPIFNLVDRPIRIHGEEIVNESIDGDRKLIPGSLTIGTWKPWSPTYTNITIGDGTAIARYTHTTGNLIIAYFRFTLGGTSSIGTNPDISTPVPARPSYVQIFNNLGGAIFDDASANTLTGLVRLETKTTLVPVSFLVNGTRIIEERLSATLPFTWTTPDILSFTAVYEAA